MEYAVFAMVFGVSISSAALVCRRAANNADGRKREAEAEARLRALVWSEAGRVNAARIDRAVKRKKPS
jgi:hypothetical protein